MESMSSAYSSSRIWWSSSHLPYVTVSKKRGSVNMAVAMELRAGLWFYRASEYCMQYYIYCGPSRPNAKGAPPGCASFAQHQRHSNIAYRVGSVTIFEAHRCARHAVMCCSSADHNCMHCSRSILALTLTGDRLNRSVCAT